jgi:hypothetical protein
MEGINLGEQSRKPFSVNDLGLLIGCLNFCSSHLKIMNFAQTICNKISIATVVMTAAVGIGYTESASAANLVQNGSFESTPTQINDGGWALFNRIDGWQGIGGAIEIQRGAAGAAQDGKNLLELDSHNYDPNNTPVLGVFQDIATEIGKLYTLSFSYSARPGTAAADNVFKVLFGDNFSQTISSGAGGGQTNWINFTAQVLATSTTTRLQFNNEGPLNTLGNYLDNVSLTEVSSEAAPEPMTMVGAAIAGLGIATRKKFKKRPKAEAIVG